MYQNIISQFGGIASVLHSCCLVALPSTHHPCLFYALLLDAVFSILFDCLFAYSYVRLFVGLLFIIIIYIRDPILSNQNRIG